MIRSNLTVTVSGSDNGEKADFAIVSQEQVASILSEITGIFTIFLGALAGISLLVGVLVS